MRLPKKITRRMTLTGTYRSKRLIDHGVSVQMLMSNGAVERLVTMHLMILPPELKSQVGKRDAGDRGIRVVDEVSHTPPSKRMYSKAPPRYQSPKRLEVPVTELSTGDEVPEACTVIAADQVPVE